MRGTLNSTPRLAGASAVIAVAVALGACEDTASPRPVPASVAIVAGDSQQGMVGLPLDSAVAVAVEDRWGAPVSGVLVRFSAPASQGMLEPSVATTGQDGRAQSVWTLPTTAGRYAATVSVSGLDSLAFTATAVAATPAVVTLEGGGGQVGEVGQPLDSAVRIRVQDGYGNPAPGVTVDFQVVKGSSTPVTPAVVTDTAGLAETVWLLGSAAGYDTMVATVAGAPAASVGAIAFPHLIPDSLGAGGDLTCRLAATASVQCWGGDTALPVTVTSLPSLTAITVGVFEACGLDPGGAAWCWGAPWNASPPTLPAPGLQFVQLSRGYDYTCGVTASGAAHCRYQTGAFQPVAGNLVFRQVSAGFSHACGVTRDGRAYCWGDDGYEQLGNGGGGSSAVPVAVATAERFHLIAAGTTQSCGLTADGRMFCWGTLSQGATPFSAPTLVYQGRQFVDVDAGFYHICGVQTDGQGACFGNNDFGQLGGTASGITSGPPGFRRIAAGGRHSCGVAQDGSTWCWGDNRQGSVGVGPTAQRGTPDSVVGGQLFAQLASGFDHSCGLTSAGAAWCWGHGNAGQLGSGVADVSAMPAAVAGGYAFVRLSAGTIETCGVTAAGAGLCWGALSGSSTPVPVPGGYTFTSISVGSLSACGVTTAGDAVCWGRNTDGQLGDSTTVSSSAPVKVVGGLTFADVAVGSRFACGVTTIHEAWCWGTAALGDGTLGARPWPGPVSGGLSFDRVAASGSNDVVCAITTADEAWCWGQGMDGQLGDGTLGTPAPTPVPVSGGHQFSTLSLANNSTCGLTTAGAVLCWGYNGNGQLGDGSGATSAVPVPVQASPGALAATTAGLHGCLVDAGGSARCWGSNNFGELGIGVTGFLFTPVQVP